MFVGYNARRVSCCRAVFWNVFHDDRTSANDRIVTNGNILDYAASWPNINIVANNRWGVFVRSYRYELADITVTTYNGKWMNYDGHMMPNIESLPDVCISGNLNTKRLGHAIVKNSGNKKNGPVIGLA